MRSAERPARRLPARPKHDLEELAGLIGVQQALGQIRAAPLRDHPVGPDRRGPQPPAKPDDLGKLPVVAPVRSKGDHGSDRPPDQTLNRRGGPIEGARAAHGIVRSLGPLDADLNEPGAQGGEPPGRPLVYQGPVGEDRKSGCQAAQPIGCLYGRHPKAHIMRAIRGENR